MAWKNWAQFSDGMMKRLGLCYDVFHTRHIHMVDSVELKDLISKLISPLLQPTPNSNRFVYVAASKH